MTEIRTVELENGTKIYEQDFEWDSKQKGLILSSFFYGYITTQLVGGYLATKVGGNVIFGCGIGVTAFLTLFTPMAANLSIYALIAVRVVEGVFEGLTFPCAYHLWSNWAPPLGTVKSILMKEIGNYNLKIFRTITDGRFCNGR
jgi:MFS transporter, ACS family, solute carrier family 17 (sodium-dependent inorganic phosphate cotransporter), other